MSARRAVALRVTTSLALIWLAAVALSLPLAAVGATPSPSRPASTDTRSPLEGPGFVGAPLAAILAVVGIAVIAIVVTTIYVRLTGDRTDPPGASG